MDPDDLAAQLAEGLAGLSVSSQANYGVPQAAQGGALGETVQSAGAQSVEVSLRTCFRSACDRPSCACCPVLCSACAAVTLTAARHLLLCCFRILQATVGLLYDAVMTLHMRQGGFQLHACIPPSCEPAHLAFACGAPSTCLQCTGPGPLEHAQLRLLPGPHAPPAAVRRPCRFTTATHIHNPRPQTIPSAPSASACCTQCCRSRASRSSAPHCRRGRCASRFSTPPPPRPPPPPPARQRRALWAPRRRSHAARNRTPRGSVAPPLPTKPCTRPNQTLRTNPGHG